MSNILSTRLLWPSLWTAAVVVSSYIPGAMAASFDCEKAASAVELLVCDDNTLSAADEEMARLYQQAKALDRSVVAEQAEWLRDVRNTCQDTECLSKVHIERIAQLERRVGFTSTSPSTNPVEQSPQTPPTTPSSQPAFAPSFDCHDALGAVEQMICGDETLSAADRELERLLAPKIGQFPNLTQEQAQWKASIRDRCDSVECISEAYLDRIAVVEHMQQPTTTAPTLTPPTFDGTAAAVRNSLYSENGIYLFWTAVGFVIFMLILGANNTVVICYDHADFFWSAAPLLFIAAGFVIQSTLPHDVAGQAMQQQPIVMFGTLALSAFAFVKIFTNAINYNKSLSVGIMVGVFKVMLGLLTLVIVLGSLGGGNNRARGRSSSAIATLAIIGLLFWVYRAVINGPSVYAKKQWPLVTP